MARVLVDLRERHEDFLGPSAFFGLFGLGLLVEFWSELSFNGEEGEEREMLKVAGDLLMMLVLWLSCGLEMVMQFLGREKAVV